MSKESYFGGLENLEPDTEIRLYIIDGSKFGGPVYHFHGHDFGLTAQDVADAQAAGVEPPFKSIYYLKDTNNQPIEFGYWPCECTGLGHDSSGPSKTPTLRVGNLDGVVSSMCLNYAGMAQADVSIIITEAQYLDPKTFGKTTPAQDPLANVRLEWLVSRPSSINAETVTFELMSPVDYMEFKLPSRQITSLCEFAMRGDYRGEGCGYTGTLMFDEKDNPVTDPAKDKCGGRYVSCGKRFGVNNILNFGGQPTAGIK